MSTTSSILPPTSATSTTTSGTTTNPSLNLQPADFLNMMVTQLENQDPLNPTSSSELLSQMSQIGQLQSSNTLQSSLQSFGLQTSIASASSMMGKMVQGLDSNSNPISGVVTSVQVASGNVALQLDNGNSLPLSAVTSISPAPTGTTTASTSMTMPIAMH